MQTIQLSVYSFAELSETAKEVAINQYRQTNDDDYHSLDEFIDTLKKGCDAFNVLVVNYSIDPCYASQSWVKTNNRNDNTGDLKGVRLRTWLINNFYDVFYTKERNKVVETCCPFTGVCFDENFLDTFRDFIKKPDNRTFSDLIEEAIESVLQAIQADYEYQNSDEYIIETIEANDYVFLATGKQYY